MFAFLAFLLHIPLFVCRVLGVNFPLARDTQHSLYIELVLSCIELFCFFLTVCIWGGACYGQPPSGLSVHPVGYGLMIACFFFLIINTICYALMRTNENLVVGNGASRGGGGGGEYGGGGGGEYSSGDAGDSSQPTFSYQANASDNSTL